MRHFIVLLIAILTLTLSWANLTFAASLTDGENLAAQGDIQGALTIYQDLAKQHPDSAETFSHLGGMQLISQQYPAAIKSFQRAITLGDEGTGTFVGMGMAYLHMGQHGPARAAFVEAKQRGVSNPEDIDRVIEWIDKRDGGMAANHPPIGSSTH